MLNSGVAQHSNVDQDFEEDSDSKVHVLVHDLRPPFLDGTVAYTRQLEPINPVRDVTSDMAVFSKKGSLLVKERRERQEREKAAAKAASVAGTTLGNIMGVKDEPDLGEGKSSPPISADNSRRAKRWRQLQDGIAVLDTLEKV
jgi:pre-mRNA-splicing factor ATP-dependent RNA helicase DHX38/PRP16